jgi:hypothetical protein
MRQLLITAGLPLLLLGCSMGVQPEVRLSIKSDRILGVEDFEYSPAGSFSPCNVSGEIEYDIGVEPSNFTGYVQVKDAVIEYAGKWKKIDSRSFSFVNGKQVHGTSIYQYPLDDASAVEKEATCASRSSSDIKLISLGKPIYAIHGVKVVIQASK